MPNIPQFNAQIQQIQVPSLRNFQEQQEEQIYKAVANVADTTSKLAEELYVEGQKYKATVAGGKITSKDDLKNLPEPTTPAQQAYNNAAITSFTTDFMVNGERVINESAFKNNENPQKFLEETGAYINGIAENVPEHLRTQVLKPMEMARESKYSTLLKHQVDRNREISLEQFRFNSYRLRQNANYIDSDEALDRYLAGGLQYAQQGLYMGAKASEMQAFLNNYNEAGLIRYLSKYYLKEKIDPVEYKKFMGNAVQGNTGIGALDMMPPDVRLSIVKSAFNDLNDTENALATKIMTVQSTIEAGINAGTAADMSKQFETEVNPAYFAATELTRNEVYNSDYIKAQLVDVQKNIDSGNIKETLPQWSGKVLEAAKNGSLTMEDLDRLKDDGVVGDKEYLDAYNAMNSFVVKNRNLPAYAEAVTEINTSNPDIVSENGDVQAVNLKRKQLYDKLNAFVDTREMTNEDIYEFMKGSISNTNSMIDEKKAYKQQFTQDNFYKLFGVRYSDVDATIHKHIKGTMVVRHAAFNEVKQKYKVNTGTANAMLTYWENIRKTEANQ